MKHAPRLALGIALSLQMSACATAGTTTATGTTNTTGPKAPQEAPAPSVLEGRCGDSLFGPSVIPKASASQRFGATATRFAQVSSSRDRAVEVCGVEQELEWLTTVRCADGRPAYASLEAAHASRRGNVGPGGPCRHIIDLYDVQCPEGPYEVYMDMYVCTEGEAF